MSWQHTAISIRLFICLATAAGSAAAQSASDGHDAHLCRYAQRLLVNAAEQDFPVIEQVGTGNGFHVIQMDVDAADRSVSIAMTTDHAEFDGMKLATHVSCKTVDRDRINDVLDAQLPGPEHQCRDVNERTHALALAGLTNEERSRYLDEGRRLAFGEDAILASGGEWLPVTMDAFIEASGDEVVVRSPSVRVPWNPAERNFYQGTQHCKLVTLAAMDRWMRVGAFEQDGALIPATDSHCAQPHSMTSSVGSCLFYFAPADALFCQDYSGAGWDPDSAREECSKRHASADALRAAQNRYAGDGGVLSLASCASREDAPPINGTCVFHCDQPDETLWHVTGAIDPRMTRGCDLFVRRAAPLRK